MKTAARLVLPLAALLLLPACDRSGPKLGETAVRELGELQFSCTAGEGGLGQEYLELFSRVQATGDVKQASTPHRISLLHLAALHKKAALLADLLRAGADPNARTLVADISPDGDPSLPGEASLREGDPVLGWALVAPEQGGAPASVILPLVEALVAAGADVRALDAQGIPLLALATFNPHPTAEEVFLDLLERGAVTEGKPVNELAAAYPLGHWVAERCWPRAMTALLDKGYAPRGMLPELADHAGEPGALECARLLLERGAKAGECSRDGEPALYAASRRYTLMQRDEAATNEERSLARDMVLLLLKAGADASQPCGAESASPGFCAADLLHEARDLPALLAGAGLPPLPVPTLDFSAEGEAFLAQVCRAGRLSRHFGDEALAPHADRLASLLDKPAEEMQQSVLFPAASDAALRLLTRVDAARAAKLLVAHPCWKVADWGEEGSLNGVFLAAVEDEPRLVLPALFLQAQAVEREAAGHGHLAAAFIELLARDRSAAAAIERLCSDERLALRVGAMTARLLQAGLPAPRNMCVADWATERKLRFEDAPPAIQTAWLATSLEEIWLGEADAERREAIIAALRAIGAAKAAGFYANPAEAGEPEDMALELEELTAKYIWENRAAFGQFPG